MDYELLATLRRHHPAWRPVIAPQILDHGEIDLAADALFEQFFVDKERLRARLRRALQTRGQIGLTELLESEPLEQGVVNMGTESQPSLLSPGGGPD
jgi:hypothetical protein